MKFSLKVVTTPMCEEIVKLAGISNYTVSKAPDSVGADMAVVLSETKLSTKSIKIKLNTFSHMKDDVMNENVETVEIPSHKNVPLSAIKRAEMRYNILEKRLCMKP